MSMSRRSQRAEFDKAFKVMRVEDHQGYCVARESGGKRRADRRSGKETLPTPRNHLRGPTRSSLVPSKCTLRIAGQ